MSEKQPKPKKIFQTKFGKSREEKEEAAGRLFSALLKHGLPTEIFHPDGTEFVDEHELKHALQNEKGGGEFYILWDGKQYRPGYTPSNIRSMSPGELVEIALANGPFSSGLDLEIAEGAEEMKSSLIKRLVFVLTEMVVLKKK